MSWLKVLWLKLLSLINKSMSTKPNITVDFVGDVISFGNGIKYRGINQGPDGNLYTVPYASNFVVKHNPITNEQERFDVTGYTSSTITQKYVGGAAAPNGKIYTGAHKGTSPLIIDTNTGTVSEVAGYTSSELQSRGAAYWDGKVYIPSYTGGKVFRVIDTENDIALRNIPWAPIDREDNIFKVRTNYKNEGFAQIYDTNFGAVAGGNGKIYGMPYGASRVNILDTATGKTSWSDTEITGNAPVGNTLLNAKTFTNVLFYATWFNKYKTGALASNGCIYAHGTMARSILKIDTSDDSTTEIPYPQEIIDAMLKGVDDNPALSFEGRTKYSASFSSFLGGDGKVYNTPWGLPYLIWIDPKDDSIGYIDLSDKLNVENTGAKDHWYTFGCAVGNQLFFSPGKAEKILRITLDDLESEEVDNSEDKINNSVMSEIKINSNDITPGVRNLLGVLLSSGEDEEITITISDKEVAPPTPSPSAASYCSCTYTCCTPTPSPSAPTYNCCTSYCCTYTCGCYTCGCCTCC